MSVKLSVFHQQFLAKFAGSVSRMFLAVLVSMIVPKALGPAAYGSFEFLKNFFQHVMAFLDMGSSSAFYAKFSRNVRDAGVLRFYAGVCVSILFVLVTGFTIVLTIDAQKIIWPVIPVEYLMLALVLGYFLWLYTIFQRLLDSLGQTIQSEKLITLLRILVVTTIAGLYWRNVLDIYAYFTIEILAVLVTLLAMGMLAQKGWKRSSGTPVARTPSATLMSEFYNYCAPLFWLALVGTLTSIFDIWLLQVLSGSSEQGLYFLSLRISIICLLFAAPFSQLIMREFSKAYGASNLEMIRELFVRYGPLLYALTAFISIYISVNSKAIIQIFGGAAYASGSSVLVGMGLFPLYQNYGQINAALFKATERTGLFSRISIYGKLLGVALLLYVLLPTKLGGLGLASIGLAIKVVVIQIVVVNTYLWFNLRYLGLPFFKYLTYQCSVLVVFSSVGIGAAWCAQYFVTGPWAELMVSGLIYMLFIVSSISVVPAVYGIRKSDVMKVRDLVLVRMHR